MRLRMLAHARTLQRAGGCRRLATLLACALALAMLGLVAEAGAFKWVPRNPADRLARLPMDDYRYDYARRCTTKPRAGTVALQRWLERNSRGDAWGIMRCEKLGRGNYSLHAEGRALDWRLNVHRRVERRAADRLIRLLLAPDRRGNAHALARRMGVQEIIWNCRAWWSGSERLVPYSPCYDSRGRRTRVDDTTAHRDHVHIGLNRRGAARRSTFWSRGA
jgi:hypothetical protein